MKLKLTFSLLLLLAGAYLSAQTFLPKEGFFPGSMTFKNGEIKTGYLCAPKHPKTGEIIFSADKSGKKEKIPSDQLISISIQPENGKTFIFEHLPIAIKAGKKPGKNVWLYVAVKGYTTLYAFTDSYLIDKNGNFTGVNDNNGKYGPMFPYYIRKKDGHVAFFFGYTSTYKLATNLNSTLKKTAGWYLSEDADLIKKINNKQLTHKDFEEIINIYNDYMDKKE